MADIYARNSRGGEYLCRCEWPADCFVQCGGDGIVFTGGRFDEIIRDPKSAGPVVAAVLSGVESVNAPGVPAFYRTAFFEAFPRDPDTFVRGEGETIEAAESAAWFRFEKHRACSGHEYERRGYTNGAGFCIHCGMFKSGAFSPGKASEPRP